MWSIKEMKSRGMQAFRANYWQSVAVSFIMTIITAGSAGAASSRGGAQPADVTVDVASGTMTPRQTAIVAGLVVGALAIIGITSTLLRILVGNPLEVGGRRFFKKNATNPATPFACITEGFQNYGYVIITMLLRDVFIFLWALLLIVPGVMKAYSYRMVPYLIKDNPELSPMEVLARSTEMMRGHRWQAFCMDLSFIGWLLLGVLTLNIGNIFWTNPYMNATDAALYRELSGQQA